MKRIICLICVFVLTLASGCSDKPELKPGAYVYSQSEEAAMPVVVLNEDGTFSFTYSVLSSYLPLGTYSIDGSTLSLSTQDGQNVYVFRIKKNSLIFDAEKSSSLPDFAKIPDGAEFNG